MLLEKSSKTDVYTALADVPRVLALASIVGSAFVRLPGGPIVFAILVVILLAARAARLAWPFDLAMGAWLLLSMWAAIADWYVAAPWLDWVTHCFATGAVAGAIRLLLVHPKIMHDVNDTRVPRYGIVITTMAIGTTAATFWEYYEWFAGAVGLPRPHVGYVDTIADLGMGTVGSLVVGLALLVWGRSGRSGHRPRRQERVPEPSAA